MGNPTRVKNTRSTNLRDFFSKAGESSHVPTAFPRLFTGGGTAVVRVQWGLDFYLSQKPLFRAEMSLFSCADPNFFTISAQLDWRAVKSRSRPRGAMEMSSMSIMGQVYLL